jgi:hypothetical protein
MRQSPAAILQHRQAATAAAAHAGPCTLDFQQAFLHTFLLSKLAAWFVLRWPTRFPLMVLQGCYQGVLGPTAGSAPMHAAAMHAAPMHASMPAAMSAAPMRGAVNHGYC